MNYNIYIIEEKIESYYSEAIAEYAKRLSRYCKINLNIIKKVEQIEKVLDDAAYIVKISKGQSTMTSEALAERINKLGVDGYSNITIIMEGRYKIDKYNECWQLSKMDMSIGLGTTILYEQIYRGYKINNNEIYHK